MEFDGCFASHFFTVGVRVFSHGFLRGVLWKQYPLDQEETDQLPDSLLSHGTVCKSFALPAPEPPCLWNDVPAQPAPDSQYMTAWNECFEVRQSIQKCQGELMTTGRAQPRGDQCKGTV